MISFEDFQKLDIRIGEILEAEPVPETDKLFKLKIDLGNEQRDLVAGIADTYSAQDIIGKQIPILINLEPKTIKGIESKGMILAIDVDNKATLIHPDKKIINGSKIR
ncbi:methionine--tRNA ligase subunit beta [Patescibacteria group bacterium]|nr:methionine--tRNA ligase subunit beta [Patescibacteria group bacterium]MBU3922651.1 methionine--tRNA ligase subunit beta [Patescibacteria group bacterium]